MAEVFQLPIGDIKFNDQTRQRKELTGIQELAASIGRIGLINAIVVDREHTLIAGRRRLEASKVLGREFIAARYFESLDKVEQRLVELDENLRRVDLPWAETAAAIAELHGLKQAEDPNWTQEQTAEYAGLSTGQISNSILVTKALDQGDQRVASCVSLNQAADLLRRRRQLALDTALSKDFEEEEYGDGEGLGEDPDGAGDEGLYSEVEGEIPGEDVPLRGTFQGSPGEQSTEPRASSRVLPAPGGGKREVQPFQIQQGDFLQFAGTYSGPKFNLIHCDFPYGINYDQSDMSATYSHDTAYADTEDLFWNLTDCLLANQDRLVLSSAHMIFWFSMKYYSQLVPRLEAAGWWVIPQPLIWTKSDNSGIASDFRRRPRHCYETALFCSRGDRPIIQLKADFYSCPIAKHQEGHVSAKPREMLEFFFSMICDDNSEILDPTCGSGTALRAGRKLGAVRGLGLEFNPETAAAASLRLEEDK